MNAPTPDLAAATPPCWSLEDLYASPDDPRIAADLDAARRANADLVGLKGQFLAARADPARLGALIARGVGRYEEATNALWSVGAYAGLAASVSRDDPKWALFEADVRAKSAAIGAEVVFFTLELNALEDAELEAALAADPAAARWRPWLRRVRLSRPHELSPDLERLLVDRAPAVANWVRLYDDALARLRARVGPERLTLSETLNRLSDPVADRRRGAAKGLAKALAEREDVLALCYNTLAAEKQVEDRWRRYDSPIRGAEYRQRGGRRRRRGARGRRRRGLSEDQPPLLPAEGQGHGQNAPGHWDRNAPLTAATPRAYAWDEARGMVLDSFADLDPALADRAKVFFERPWIDALPRPGKQSGAYSHSVTAPRHPYVFMNFMGERRDVLTLAHELGHAVHQTLAAPQGTLLADTPLTLAETASIFAEGLLFDRLLAEATPEDRKGLLAGKIEDALNTVVRQIAFHRFESRFHAARKEGEVSPEAIGALWMGAMGESLGPAVRLNPGYEHYWGYVSHFTHAPFYVYAYAFGNLLVEALMETRRGDPAAFAPLYERLLAGGGTRTYVEALAPFSLDPRLPSFWRAGCLRLERLVDAFEALV